MATRGRALWRSRIRRLTPLMGPAGERAYFFELPLDFCHGSVAVFGLLAQTTLDSWRQLVGTPSNQFAQWLRLFAGKGNDDVGA